MKAINVIKSLGLSIFLTAALNFAHAEEGGSNGGGGNATNRAVVTQADLKNIIETAHKLAPYNFQFIANTFYTISSYESHSKNSKTIKVDPSNTYAPVVERMKQLHLQRPNIFSELKIQIRESEPCKIENGKRASASYFNGIICFDLVELAQYRFNRQEAEIKISALYMHEVAHAAGYSDSPSDEKFLAGFQSALELLFEVNELQQYDIEANSSLFHHPSFIKLGLEELEFGSQDESRSLVWICLKQNEVLNSLSTAAINNRQESNGYSLLSSEKENILDLLVWELALLGELNCDGLDRHDNAKEIMKWPESDISLRDVLKLRQNVDFCSSEYSQKVCQLAKNTRIKKQRQNLSGFKKDLFFSLRKITEFLNQNKLL